MLHAAELNRNLSQSLVPPPLPPFEPLLSMSSMMAAWWSGQWWVAVCSLFAAPPQTNRPRRASASRRRKNRRNRRHAGEGCHFGSKRYLHGLLGRYGGCATRCPRNVRCHCGCTTVCRRVKLNPIRGGNMQPALDTGGRTLPRGYDLS